MINIIDNDKLISIINNMTFGTDYDHEFEIPEIGVTDDIGQCDGFDALISSKLGESSQIAYRSELNSETYDGFDPDQKDHTFILDYVHKDVDTSREIAEYYMPINDFYLDTLSFNTLAASALEAEVPLNANNILKYLKRKRDLATQSVRDRDPSRISSMRDNSSDLLIDKLIKDTEQKDYKVIARSKNNTGNTSNWRLNITKNKNKTEIPKIEFITSYISDGAGKVKDIVLTKYAKDKNYANGNLEKLLTRLKKGTVTTNGGVAFNLKDSNERSNIVYYNKIRNKKNITRIVVHGTAGGTAHAEGQVEYWSTSDGPKRKSDTVFPTQFIIDRSGKITCLFNPLIATVHGSESFEEIQASIGIELINPNRDNSGEYTPEQYKALTQLIFGYLHDYNIKTIVSHSYNILRRMKTNSNTSYKKCPGTEFYPNILMEHIAEYCSDITPIGVNSAEEGEDTDYTSSDMVYRLETAGREVEIDILSILTTYRAKLEGFLTDILISSFENIYKTLSYDFSKNIEDLSVNIVPGSSGRIMMKGENAPIIQSTGGRIKTLNVIFNTSSVLEIARLTGLFKVTAGDETKISMLMMSRSLFKAGDSPHRLKYINEYFKQDNFNKIIQSVVGKKTNRRFDEPIRITNEFINAMGISTCIPSSLEITTSDENPSSYKVSITFNAINLGNRNIENLKREKVGSNIPIMPLAMRNTITEKELDDKTFSEHKLISMVSSTAARYALAEYLPLYVISRIGSLYDNLVDLNSVMKEDTEPNSTYFIDMTDPVIAAFATSSKSISDNESYIIDMLGRKMAKDMTERDYTGDISFQSWGDAATDFFGGIVQLISDVLIYTYANKFLKYSKGTVKPNGATISFLSDMIKPISTSRKYLFGTAAISTLIASIGLIPESSKDNNNKKLISINILELIPSLLHEFLHEYFESIRGNKINHFIKYHADRAKTIIHDKILSGGENYPFIPFPQEIPIRTSSESEDIKMIAGIRLYMFGNSLSLKNAEKELRKKISGNIAATTNAKVKEDKENLDKIVGSMIHHSAEMINYWSIVITNDINNILIDKGGDGIISTIINGVSPSHMASTKTLIGIKDLSTTADLILGSEVYVKHIIEATNALMVSANIDKIAGLFLMEPADEKQKIINTLDPHINKYFICVNKVKKHGSAVLRKYGVVPEIFSGNIITNKYQSDEVRIFTSYSLQTVFSMISNYVLSSNKDPYTGKSVTTLDKVYEMIFPDRKEAIKLWINYIGNKIIDIISDRMGIILLIAGVVVGIFALVKLAGAAIIAGTITGIGAVFYAIVKFLLSTSVFILLAIKDAVDLTSAISKKTIEIIIRRGNLLKISRHLLNQARTNVSHRTLVQLAYDSSIWFHDVLNFKNEIADDKNNSYVDYPSFSFAGEILPPDFWIAKINHIDKAYNDVLSTTSSILQIAKDNLNKVDNNYEVMINLLKERLTGVDREVINSAEISIYNHLSESVDYTNSGYFNDLVKSSTNVTRKIAELGDIIDSKMLPSSDKEKQLNYGYVFIRVLTSEGIMLNERKNTSEKMCAITLNIYPRRCEIRINDMFTTIAKELYRITNEGVFIPTNIEIDHSIFDSNSISKVVSTISTVIRNLSTTMRSSNELVAAFEPETMNNIMMLRGIVGSHLMSVGKPGLSYLTRTIKENTRDMIKRSLISRIGYLYPTVKLFFIDEDSEAYYLFDDLYSYGSIVDYAISDDENSPIQVCELTLTNIYGNLNNVYADRVPEYSFVTDKDEYSQLNSMMLRTGCKIKIQEGTSTILTEKDTVFTGRITNIQFGEITKIQATSMGDCLLEEVSKERAKIYGDNVWLDEIGYASQAVSYVSRKTARLLTKTYNTPITSIKNIVGYALTDATVRGKLDDFTINPELGIDFDQNINLVTSDYTTALRNRFFPDAISHVLKMGGIEVNTGFNNQLKENILIKNDNIKEITGIVSILGSKGTSWVSLDDTTWDILQEINMLLPNNLVRSLPYETRSTLVWGSEDDYYRYKRGSDLDTIISTSMADYLRFTNDEISKLKIIVDVAIAAYNQGQNTGDWEWFTNIFAVLALIVDYANNLGMAYNASVPESKMKIIGIRDNLNISDPSADIVKNILEWFGFETSKISNFKYIMEVLLNRHNQSMTAYNDALDRLKEEEVTTHNLYLNDLKLGNYIHMKFIKGYPSAQQEKSIFLKMFFMEIAAEYYLSDIYKTCSSISNSYKRISNIHMKMSGKDIISNDIMLMDAFNTVRITYPEAGNEKAIISNMSDSWRKSTDLIPIHYKLEPRVWKTYSSFFRNANIFPKARHSVISMYTTSTLTNLISQSYGGTIEILGDQNIKAGDRIFIYDELSDMYGLIRVGSLVRKFSRENGWTITITPRMISKNESKLEELMSSILGDAIDILYKIAFILGVGDVVSKLFGIVKRKTQTTSIINNISKGAKDAAKGNKILKIAKALQKKAGSLREKLPPGLTSKAEYSIINNTISKIKNTHPEHLENIIKEALTQKASLEAILIGEKARFNIIVGNALKSVFKNHPSREIPKIEKEELIKTLEQGISEVFSIKNRTSTNASKDIQDIVNIFINEKIKVANPKLTPEELATLSKEISSAMSTKEIWSKFNKEFVELQKYTTDGFTNIKIDGVTTESINLATKSILETAVFNSNSLIGDLLSLGGTAFRTFSAISLGSMLFEGIKEMRDLYLNNTLTASNVSISPLFFRDEPFISNLDGMTKQDGEKVGIGDITSSRFNAATQGLFSSIMDPVQEMIARNTMILSETLKSKYE